jgi:hypothetical protein
VATAEPPTVFELELITEGNVAFVGRFTGWHVVEARGYDIYVTDDKRVIWVNEDGSHSEDLEDDQLRERLSLDDYLAVLNVLGEGDLVVDL